MSGFSLLSNILRQPWMIDKQYADASLAFLFSLMDGKAAKFYNETKEEMAAKTAPFAMAMSAGIVLSNRYSSYDDAPKGSVAIHTIAGPLMKQDADCGGPPGYETLAKRMKEADSHSNIVAHVIKTDSPGGAALGLNTMMDSIRSLSKPVVGFVDDMSTSAAYGIVSSTNLVVASSGEALVGSIGTQLTMVDFTEYYKARGIKQHNVRATKSEDKNEASLQVFENNYEPIRQELLDPLNDGFLANIQTNREGKLNLEEKTEKGTPTVFTGKVYTASVGLTNGLVDEIGSLEYAVQRAIELAEEEPQTSRTSNQSNMKMNTFLAGMFAAIGLTSSSEKEELTQEDFTQATDKINELNQLLETANSEKADAIAKLDAAQTSITEKDNTITDLQNKLKEYDDVSAAARTGVNKDKDEDPGNTTPPASPTSWEQKASKVSER